MTRTLVVGIVASIAGAALVIALIITQPWLAFIDVRVDERLPTAAPQGQASAAPADTDAPSGASATPSAPSEPTELSSGTLISHEHETTGTVRVVENPDGSRVLAIENLSTTNGPDVHVWLSASDVVEGIDGWFVAGDAAFYDLGPIKGNLGNQLYEIPAEVDLSQFRSVSLWCVQFGVSFGAVQLV